jgi:hypothetical protein
VLRSEKGLSSLSLLQSIIDLVYLRKTVVAQLLVELYATCLTCLAAF